MSKEFIFRHATEADQPAILAIIRQAQAQMAEAGSDQWQNGYPAAPDIERDRRKGVGYVLCEEGCVVAYGAVVFTGEEAYTALEGAWNTPEEYVVVHRLAVARTLQGRGIAAEFLRRVEALARTQGVYGFRIDTNFDNRRMLRLLERKGFSYTGKVRYESGERLAFDKPINR